MAIDVEKLEIIHYPDPRLRKLAAKVTVFDAQVEAIARRMLVLMRGEKGVGLAAPQVGLAMRLFVMNPTGKDGDDLVIINPELRDMQNPKDGEEGCLSIPDVRVQVKRAARCSLRAHNLMGEPVELQGEELVARIWQHETDHLNGMMIIDRMGPADKIAVRGALRELEADWVEKTGRPVPKKP